MKPALAATLLFLIAAPGFAQGVSQSQSNDYSGPRIGHTGPRYCPELADTGHPFAAVCPSHRESIEANRSDYVVVPVLPAELEDVSSPIWSNGGWYGQ